MILICPSGSRAHADAMVGRAAWRLHQGDKPIVPAIDDGSYGYPHVNAAIQRRDPNSMLNWMERIIRMRKEMPEIGWGTLPSSRRATRRCS